MIKAMLKSGVVDECEINEDGTPQGGILSPLLSNVYLDIFDQWMVKQWGEKETRHAYKQSQARLDALRKNYNLKSAFPVRYADDFVVMTNNRQNALWWKTQIQSFLETIMKLNLSEEKTLITDVRKEYIHFLRYQYKVLKGKSRLGYIPRTLPDKIRLKRKMDIIVEGIKHIPRNYSRERAIHEINLINSKICGLINYYGNCTWVTLAMNTFIKVILPLEEDEALRVKEVLSDEETLQVIRNRRGEGLLCAGHNRISVAFHSTQKEYEMITTSRDDLEAQMQKNEATRQS